MTRHRVEKGHHFKRRLVREYLFAAELQSVAALRDRISARNRNRFGVGKLYFSRFKIDFGLSVAR